LCAAALGLIGTALLSKRQTQDGTIRVSVGATGIAQVHDGPAQRRKPREFDRFLHPVTPQRV
jgi:hypothetical protein